MLADQTKGTPTVNQADGAEYGNKRANYAGLGDVSLALCFSVNESFVLCQAFPGGMSCADSMQFFKTQGCLHALISEFVCAQC